VNHQSLRPWRHKRGDDLEQRVPVYKAIRRRYISAHGKYPAWLTEIIPQHCQYSERGQMPFTGQTLCVPTESRSDVL